MKPAKPKWLLLPSLSLLLACQSADVGMGVPARMGADSTSGACILQLQDFVTSSQGLSTVLTSAAFAESSILSIAEAPVLDAKGNLQQGRERSLPTVYRLSKNIAGCTITREGGGGSGLLSACSCVAAG